MDIDKSDLIAKLDGIYKFVFEFEELVAESQKKKNDVATSESILADRIESFIWSIIKLVIYSALVVGILYWSGNIKHVFSWKEVYFSGFLGVLQFLGGAIFLVLAVINLIKIPVYLLLQIPKGKINIVYYQNIYDGMPEKFGNLYDSMADEKADTEELFPDDNYFPFSRHVKYCVDSLKTGRADNFKEALLRLDEMKHREKIEEEAEEQTKLARQTARNSEEALRAARNAESAAYKAARDASAARNSADAARYRS